MKRIVLGLAIATAAIFNTNSSSAQFTVAHDTVRAAVYGTMSIGNDITNTTSSPITIDWKVVYHNLPVSWQQVVGICDNSSCYGNNVLGSSATPDVPPFTPPGSLKTSDTFSNKMDFHLQNDFTNATAGGPYYITIELISGTLKDSTTFELLKWQTNVNQVKQTANNAVSLYPNPAKDELNVVFDANAGVKTIAIRNIIGKVVGMYKVSGNSAKLNVSNLQSGIYFINLTDGQGHTVAIRKFTTN